MSEALESLFQCREVKAFAKQFKELEKEWGEPANFVAPVALYLAPRLYQPFYDEDTQHSLLGLAAAVRAAPLFPPDQAWWPFVQQAWHAANERKRGPLPWEGIEAAGGDSPEESWTQLETALDNHSFSDAFAAVRSLHEQNFGYLRDRLLHHSLHDSAGGGLGFIRISQYLELVSQVGADAGLGLLASTAHFLVNETRDCSLAGSVERFAGQSVKAAASSRELDPSSFRKLEEEVLFGAGLENALQAAAGTAASAGLDALWDGLLLAGINAVCNARAGHWVRPARAFLVAYLAQHYFASAAAQDGTKVALYAAGLLHQASARSRHSGSNRDLEEVARQLCPLDAFNTLRSVVSHSDPFASATAVYAILGMGEEKLDQLCGSLATLAAKNDGRMGRGYDLLLVKAAVDSYRASKLDGKDRFLSGCAFFLGRLPKDYELFGAYGV